MLKRIFLLPLLASFLWSQQTVDNSGAAKTLPFRLMPAEPGVCSTGEYYWNTTSQIVRRCTAANVWSDVPIGSYTFATLPTGVGTGFLAVATDGCSGGSTANLCRWTGSTWSSIGGGGGVTSVGESFTGGLISVAGSPITTSGTLALTVAGTSGGVPYFNSATTWLSSGALTANGVMLGGGPGAAPTVTGADSTTTHALFATAGAPAFRGLATSDLPALIIANPYTNVNGALTYSANPLPCLSGVIPYTQWSGIGSQQGQGTRLFTAPAGWIYMFSRVESSSGFVGTGITNLTIALGTSGTPNGYMAGYQILPASGTPYNESQGPFAGAAGASTVDFFAQMTVTGGAGNLSALTAGGVTVKACGMVP